MAEYEALVLGMKLAIQLKARRLVVFNDSQLVVGQVAQGLEVKEPILQKYSDIVQKLKGKFEHFEEREHPSRCPLQISLVHRGPRKIEVRRGPR